MRKTEYNGLLRGQMSGFTSIVHMLERFRSVKSSEGKIVVSYATSDPIYAAVQEECCMKYSNCPIKMPEAAEMLPFMQHFELRNDILSKMLYLVQDYENLLIYTQPAHL